MIVTSEAIALHSRKYGDTSKLISFYTYEDGVITCIAKGARQSKNKFGSSLESLTLSQITYYKKKSTDLYLLSKAETVNPYNNLLNLFDKLNVGLGILETIILTQIKNDRNINIFNLLKSALFYLNDASDNYYNYFLKFQMELTKIIGYSLDLSFLDFDMHQKSINEYILNMESGEFSSNSNGFSSFTLNYRTAEYFKNIEDTEMSFLSKIDVEKATMKRLNTMMALYFSYHLGKKIFFKTMNNYLEPIA